MDNTDGTIIRRIQEGDINKFEELVEKYSPKIRSFISARLFDKSHGDDIVQNSFIQFYKSLERFDITKPVYPYLLQIARNELYMFFRKNHSTVSLDDNLTHATTELAYEDPIETIVSGLKSDNKDALLWFAEGYSYEEIAKKLKKPLNTVRTLIRRARLYIQKNYTHEK